MSDNALAIVIPAYRSAYLSRALQSIARQTDRHFHVYIGDDASPEPVEKIVDSFRDRLLLTYHRFSENLGGKSLSKHWARCIGMSKEPWVWLFSDDDMMEPACVSAFYQTLENTGGRHDVYRFNTITVDANDCPLRLNPPHPEQESWMQFAYFLLRGERVAVAQEAIFSRTVYDRCGWVDFPLAWGTDHASQMQWAQERGFKRIDGARLLWRWSGQNISSTRDRKLKMLKARASMAYAEWLLQKINATPDPDFPLPPEVFKPLLRDYFLDGLKHERRVFDPFQSFAISRFISKTWGDSMLVNLLRLWRINVQAIVSGARNLIHE